MNLNPLPFLSSAWQALRRAPVAKYLKPLWKGALKEMLIQKGGDVAQAELVKLIRAKESEALKKANAVIDGLQKRFKDLLHKLPFVPDDREADICQKVDEAVDLLQERLGAALERGGTEAAVDGVNQAFDRFQEDLKKRIDAL